MIRRPPRSTRTDTLFPYTTLFRSDRANRAKSAFLAMMSHELRTPLSTIIGFAEMIEQQAMGPVGNAKYSAYAADIRESGQHLLGITNDILRSEEHTSELQSLMRISYAVFCLKKKKTTKHPQT